MWPLPSSLGRSHHGYNAYLNASFKFPYRSLKAIVVQLKNCQFGINTTVQLKNMTTAWRQYRHICKLKHSPTDGTSAVFARWELWLVRSTTASVQCSSECESEEVRHVHVTFLFRSLLNYYFCNIPRYTIIIGWLHYSRCVVILKN